MGAWGHDVFENDTACDWVYELEEQGVQHVLTTLTLVRNSADYLDADVGCEGLAAAETVARMLGRPGQRDGSTESLDAWLAANPATPSQELIEAAIAAVDRVLADDSELAELWADGSGDSGWTTVTSDLRKRLASE